jgi:hypothetical protein
LQYDQDAYDFEAALAAAKIAPKGELSKDPQAAAEAVYLRRFASGGIAGELTYGMGQSTRAQHGAAASFTVTAEDFHRHAQRFGAECVAETASAFGGKVAFAPRSGAKRQRRTTVSLRDQVLALHGRGVVAAAIADRLNVSDRRVANILKAA